MQSDPQDEQPTLPDSRDGQPQEPVAGEQGLPTDESPDTSSAPEPSPPGAAPPRMPVPPAMPAGGPPPSAWGSPPPPTPAMPAAGPASGSAPKTPGQDDAGPEVIEATDPPAPTVEAPADALVVDEAAGPAAEAGQDPSMGVVRPTPTTGVAPVVQGDWLASVCPYLTSEDGAYRSAAPDEGHRCTAQDPAATLPLAFQERFCLTDRHPRCEMYKFAQETDASGGIPADRVPPTDPPTPRTGRSGGPGPNRPLLATLAGIAGLVIVVLLVVTFMGSCSGDGSGDSTTDPDQVSDEQATEAPASEPTATPEPTPQSEETSDAESTPDEAASEAVRILYEVQPDEALLRVSETFGISRNRIRRENPELEDLAPADLPGTIIELPIVGDMTLAEAQALPGYQGLVSELEAAAEG